MAIKVAAWGGSDWVDGDVAFAADMLATLKATGRYDAVTLEDSAGVGRIKQPNFYGWTLIASDTPASVTTITSPALTAYDEYMVIYKLTRTDASGTSRYLSMRLNGDSGNNYQYTVVAGTGATDNHWLLSLINKENAIIGRVTIGGKTPTIASGTLGMNSEVIGGISTTANAEQGIWTGGSAVQVSTITTLDMDGAATFSGTIRYYGRSF